MGVDLGYCDWEWIGIQFFVEFYIRELAEAFLYVLRSGHDDRTTAFVRWADYDIRVGFEVA